MDGKREMPDRELLFSVTREDFELQTFRAGGKGGQGQNKRSTGVRLIHKASGARGEARDERSFDQNRKNAFLRLVETKEFKTWHKIETARRLGYAGEIDRYIQNAMEPQHLMVEVKDANGRWVEWSNEIVDPWEAEEVDTNLGR
jgi:protein subunit release factor B